MSTFTKWSSIIKGMNFMSSSPEKLNWIMTYNITSLQKCSIDQLKYQYGHEKVPHGRYSLYKDSNIEVALWKWKPSGWVPIHSHEGPCVWRVLQGRLSEARWSRDGLHSSLSIFDENDVSLADTFTRHQVMNQGLDDAISRHLYTTQN